MSPIRHRRRTAHRNDATPAELAAQLFSSADLVLLCSFGPYWPAHEPIKELQSALMLAGYRGAFNRHLIATSALLDRRAGSRYVVCRYAP